MREARLIEAFRDVERNRLRAKETQYAWEHPWSSGRRQGAEWRRSDPAARA